MLRHPGPVQTSRFPLVAVVGAEHVRESRLARRSCYIPRGRGRSRAKRTILLEDIIYAGKGRVATALVAKWGPTLSYIPSVDCACTCTHSVPGDHDTRSSG